MSNYMKIKEFDIANGRGIGVSLFFSGCPIHCKGCFNKEAWDFSAGEEINRKVIDDLMQKCSNPHINHLSLLGGEPFAVQNLNTSLEIARLFKALYPTKKLWCWTGYTIEYLISKEYQQLAKENECILNAQYELLKLLDFLIDGPFVLEEKDITLEWRGSRNQRVLSAEKIKEMLIDEKDLC